MSANARGRGASVPAARGRGVGRGGGAAKVVQAPAPDVVALAPTRRKLPGGKEVSVPGTKGPSSLPSTSSPTSNPIIAATSKPAAQYYDNAGFQSGVSNVTNNSVYNNPNYNNSNYNNSNYNFAPNDSFATKRQKTDSVATVKADLKTHFASGTQITSKDYEGNGLLTAVFEADNAGDAGTVARILTQALHMLRTNPLDPDRFTYLGLLMIAKKKPALFTLDPVVDMLLSFLRTDSSHTFRRNNAIPLLACNLLFQAYLSVPDWPVEFVHVFLEDSFGDRVWVEDDYTRAFVDNVLTTFGTNKSIVAHTNVNGAGTPSAPPVTTSSLSTPTATPPPPPATSQRPAPAPTTTAINMSDFDEEEEEFESGDFGAVAGVVPPSPVHPSATSPTPSASAPPRAAASSMGLGLDDSFEEEETMEESGSVLPTVSSPVHVHSSTPPLPPQHLAQAPAPANGNAQPPASNGNTQVNMLVRSRFKEEVRMRVKPYVLDLLKNHFSHPTDNPRNLIKVLMATIPYRESRLMASQMIEEWLNNNPSAVRFAKELLPAVVLHTTENTPEDMQTLTNILRMKPKNMHLQLYIESIVQLLGNNINYPAIALKNFIITEMVPQRGVVFNVKMLLTILKALPGEPEPELAFIFQELAANDEYKQYLRIIARRLIKTYLDEAEIKAVEFCRGLMQERVEMYGVEPYLKEQWIGVLVDIICSTMLASVPNGLIEFSAKDPQMVRQMHQMVAQVQMEGMAWAHVTMARYLSPSNKVYIYLIRKLLFLENLNQYYYGGEPVGDVERLTFRLVTNEMPLKEETLTRVVLIGLTSIAMTHGDTLDILELLLRRAAPMCLKQQNESALEIRNSQLIEAILKLSIYKLPPEITAPQFAVSGNFWQACAILCIIACFNPTTVGANVWGAIPTMKVLLEMLVTKSWKYPPFVVVGQSESTVVAQEMQAQMQEKELILDIETEMRVGTSKGTNEPLVPADEMNSVLLNKFQLMRYDIGGPQRQPPSQVIRKLEMLDSDFMLGHTLCCCRSPDFLQEIMKRQEPQQVLQWLSPIIHTNPRTLDALPVEVLCELLLASQSGSSFSIQLVGRIKQHFTAPTPQPTVEILLFFLEKLSFSKVNVHSMAKRSLSLLFNALSPKGEDILADSTGWLEQIRYLPWHSALDIQDIFVQKLRKAFHSETDQKDLRAYIMFTYMNMQGSLPSLAVDISKLLAQRRLISQQLVQDEEMYTLILQILSSAIGQTTRQQNSHGQRWVTVQPAHSPPFPIPLLVLQGTLEALTYTPSSPSHGAHGLCKKVASIFFATPNGCAVFDTETGAKLQLLDNEQILMRLANVDLPEVLEYDTTCVDAALRRLDTLVNPFLATPTHPSAPLRPPLPIKINHTSQLLSTWWKKGVKGGHALLQFLQTLEPPHAKSTRQRIRPPTLSSPHPLPLPTPPPPEPSHVRITLSSLFVSYPAPVNDLAHITFSGWKDSLAALGAKMELPDMVVSGLLENAKREPARLAAGLRMRGGYSVPLFSLLAAFYGNPAQDKRRFQELLAKIGSLGTSGHEAPALFDKVMATYNEKFTIPARVASETSASFMVSEFIGENGAPLLESHDASAAEWGRNVVRRMRASASVNSSFTVDQLRAIFQYLGCQSLELLEEFLGTLVNKFIFDKTLRARSSDLARSLLDAMTSLPSHNSGPMVDYIEPLLPDMEIEHMLRLIFSRRAQDTQATRTAFYDQYVPHLMSVLLHESSWGDLQYYIEWILQKERALQHLNPTTVLDFITAYQAHPKIPHTPHANTSEGILQFTPTSICTLAHLVILELEQGNTNNSNARMALVTSAAKQNEENLTGLVVHLSNLSYKQSRISKYGHGDITKKGSSAESDLSPSQTLLLNLYFEFPNLVSSLLSHYSPLPMVSHSQKSQLDVVLHRVVQRLMDPDTSVSAYAVLRKLAVAHPSLVIRYLATLNALLSGRGHIAAQEFVLRNYHRLYLHVLGILDILRPAVFESPALPGILITYFELLGPNQKQNKQLMGLIGKFVDFLCHFALECEDVDVISRHSHLLKNTLQVYPDLKKIGFLLEILVNRYTHIGAHTANTFSQQEVDEVREKLDFQDDVAHDVPVKRVVDTLQDLDKLSLRSPPALRYFAHSFMKLLWSKDANVRTLAYKLVIRYISHNPRDATWVISEFLDVLSSPDFLVSKQALEHAPEFYHFSLDQSEYFIQRIFAAGGKAALPHLRKIIQSSLKF